MRLSNLISTTKAAFGDDRVPEGVEYCKIGNLFWVNIVQERSKALISDMIFSGFDRSYLTALNKAISEKIEREAFQEGANIAHFACRTQRSDGFAAMPTFLEGSRNLVREAALNEAIERYVWATWWDEPEIAFEHEIIEDFQHRHFQLGEAADLFAALREKIEVTRLHIIKPRFSGFPGKELVIFVAELPDGVLTGGACGNLGDQSKTAVRAMSELFRHGLVLIQRKQNPKVLSLYEKRLLYFASHAGLTTFRRRISQGGRRQIILPGLSIDEIIPHERSSTHHVHRCLFNHQPPFIGGAIERMCL
jgi:hypothetical protein